MQNAYRLLTLRIISLFWSQVAAVLSFQKNAVFSVKKQLPSSRFSRTYTSITMNSTSCIFSDLLLSYITLFFDLPFSFPHFFVSFFVSFKYLYLYLYLYFFVSFLSSPSHAFQETSFSSSYFFFFDSFYFFSCFHSFYFISFFFQSRSWKSIRSCVLSF